MKNISKWFRLGLLVMVFFALQNVASAQLKEDKKEETEEVEPPKKEKKTTKSKKTSKSKKTTAKKSDKSNESEATDVYFDETGEWKSKIQYGVGLNPNILGFGGGQFNMRLDPMIGYKFNKWAMAGIIGGVDYYYLSVPTNLGNMRAQPIDFSYGVYARAKVLESIYIHSDFRQATYSRLKDPLELVQNSPRTLKTESIAKPELNFGLAYRSGGQGWAYEFMATYNTLYNASYIDWKSSPFDIKLGFTRNF